MLIFLVVVCIVFGGILFFVFAGFLNEDGPRYSFGEGIPRLGQLPVGCLVGIIAFGAVWFILWGIVLLLALNLLRTPAGG
ncbi:MAG TPA: hypothetical protein VFJ85_04925 [Acidimicrobiales bacterium]|nr:hypothetical protein [Acidimicrobiales bacterium]